MGTHGRNWLVWGGFLVSVFAFLSYPAFFVRYPITRDFPWVNLLLLTLAVVLVVIGLKRSFAPGHSRAAKIGASIPAALTLAVVTLFVFTVFVLARQLPASNGAPKVGQRAPDFTLTDQFGRSVSFSELLSGAAHGGSAPKGVLLVFYRGYW
jgi:hypothetical protein